MLGRTSLIEQHDDRFVVRERHEIAKLLRKVYAAELPLDRLMHGLGNVAAALNADDPCLACLTAVHLKIPDLPDQAARDELEATDSLIKSGDWNPALHPRTGTPPNPGWFAPIDGSSASASVRIAQSEISNLSSDASSSSGDGWVRLLPAKRVDELADFAEWLANAAPGDEKAIRAEIKRYFMDVGWEGAAHDLNSLLSVVIRPNVARELSSRKRAQERCRETSPSILLSRSTRYTEMLYKCYLKNGTVYLPTTVNQGKALYMDVEPVTVVPVWDAERLRRAMRGTIPRENAFAAPSIEDARKPPVLLRYTGDKSWSAFKRGASYWSICENSGNYQIEGHRTHAKGYWEQDPEQTIKFAPGTKIDEVIDRMIGILQNATRQ